MTRAGFVKPVERLAVLFAGGQAGHGLWLIESAQDRRRAANAPDLVAPVRAGATISNGRLVR